MKIGLYIGAWPQNIGNAFFDLGLKALLKQAVPEATVYPMGGAVHWMFNASQAHHREMAIGNSRIRNQSPLSRLSCNSMEIGQYAEVDLIVFAGMSMCREFVENNGRTLVDASKRGVAIMGVGAGGSLYDSDEASVFSDFVNHLGRAAIITRDDDTFNLFADRMLHIWSGIDCAFFLPDYYSPPHLSLPPFDIENFDFQCHSPSINHCGRKVIYTHHDCWGYLPSQYMEKSDTLVSDVPEDYLTLYAHVTETYSDRVHACVATLAYGNAARLYASTPRRALFRKVGASSIASELTKLDGNMLQELKENQIAKTREYIEALLN